MNTNDVEYKYGAVLRWTAGGGCPYATEDPRERKQVLHFVRDDKLFLGTLTLDAGHQFIDLCLLLAGERQEWESRRTSVVAVEVHRVFHCGDA
jgi:hypothetical protein